MLPALIGAGAGLLGGLFGRNSEKKAIAAQNEYNKPINVRARAEEAGFNPLLFVGPGVGQQTATGGVNYMGAGIADAGQMLANQLAQAPEAKLRQQQLELQNKALQRDLEKATLRPPTGGIYSATGVARGLAAAKAAEEKDKPGDPFQSVKPGSDWATNEDGAAASDEKYRPGTAPGVFLNSPVRRSGWFSDGAWYSDTYGEPAEWLVALPSMLSDVGTTAGYSLGTAIEDVKSRAHGRGPEMRVGGKRFRLGRDQSLHANPDGFGHDFPAISFKRP